MKTILRNSIHLAPAIFLTAALGFAATAPTAQDCANLAKLPLANTTITSASVIPGGGGLPDVEDDQWA